MPQIINPKATLIQVLEWTLLNSAVALVGYYFAAFTIDKTWMGRKRMQIMGFSWMVRGAGCSIHVFTPNAILLAQPCLAQQAAANDKSLQNIPRGSFAS